MFLAKKNTNFKLFNKIILLEEQTDMQILDQGEGEWGGGKLDCHHVMVVIFGSL